MGRLEVRQRTNRQPDVKLGRQSLKISKLKIFQAD
jgi:hypothetical protein